MGLKQVAAVLARVGRRMAEIQSYKKPRYRLRGKQPVPGACSEFAKSLHFFAEFLGTSVFKVASLSRESKNALHNDKQLWLIVLQNEIKFGDHKFPNAAARAVFSNLPLEVPSLRLNFYEGRSMKVEVYEDASLKLLSKSVPKCLKRLRIQIYYLGDM